MRKPRPYHSRQQTQEPLITGTRVIDAFYPVAKGGTAIVPGGFGTGKTVIEQSLARWADVNIVIYVGCGERGNGIADVLESFTRSPILYRSAAHGSHCIDRQHVQHAGGRA